MIDPKLNEVDQLAVNTIRTLAMDAVQQANSGHPGAPMGAGLMAYVLWDRVMKHNPGDVRWPDRDRFVLSAGHASMLLYACCTCRLPDLRSTTSRTSASGGAPRRATRSAGCARARRPPPARSARASRTAVGMAMAERFLAAAFNRPGHEIVDHYTYVLASDGDVQEGVTHEAARLRGTRAWAS